MRGLLAAVGDPGGCNDHHALYFSVVTIAIVGYGDLVLKTDGGKLFTVFYIMVGLGLFVSFASALSRQIIANTRKEK
ncbi:potassium channel family protein [Pseudotabrizicola alkalilacus]|uniref:potassium channel family protein n=1 Tax=Pseudotabrizicola alkalilacus TaxID=2305252 RepID=UPI0018F137C1|nr:potassium channel family protein [Pseudotabrizicola alkalilacus]